MTPEQQKKINKRDAWMVFWCGCFCMCFMLALPYFYSRTDPSYWYFVYGALAYLLYIVYIYWDDF